MNFPNLFQLCAAFLTFGKFKSPEVIQRFVSVDLEAMTVASKGQSAKDRSRVWVLPDGTLAYNGTRYADFTVKILPKTGMPIFISRANPDAPATLRVIAKPGSGSDMSHSGSLFSTGRALLELSKGAASSNPAVRFIAERYPHLLRNIEFVAFDIPGAGWAPPLSEFPTAFDLARLIRMVTNEIGEGNEIDTLDLCRSASCPFTILAADRPLKNVRAIALMGATYPDLQVAEQNLVDIRRFEAESQGTVTIRWDVANGMLARINDPSAKAAILKTAQKHSARLLRGGRPYLFALSGSNDEQTPQIARDGWASVLGTAAPPLGPTGHVTVKNAGHFILARDPKSPISADSPDIEAWRHLLNLMEMASPRDQLGYFAYPALI